jgi:hypothetical protein
MLAVEENPAENFNKSINASNEALRFYTKEVFPIQFHKIMHNKSIVTKELKKFKKERKTKN